MFYKNNYNNKEEDTDPSIPTNKIMKLVLKKYNTKKKSFYQKTPAE